MFKAKVEDGIGYIYIENTTNEPVKISNNLQKSLAERHLHGVLATLYRSISDTSPR